MGIAAEIHNSIGFAYKYATIRFPGSVVNSSGNIRFYIRKRNIGAPSLNKIAPQLPPSPPRPKRRDNPRRSGRPQNLFHAYPHPHIAALVKKSQKAPKTQKAEISLSI
jgi:hypothetical protein